MGSIALLLLLPATCLVLVELLFSDAQRVFHGTVGNHQRCIEAARVDVHEEKQAPSYHTIPTIPAVQMAPSKTTQSLDDKSVSTHRCEYSSTHPHDRSMLIIIIIIVIIVIIIIIVI